jgi:hypothetical protein
MTESAAAVFAAAMKLSEDERRELADRLLFTLSPERQIEIDRAWAEEVERRVQAVERGEMELIDGDEVFRQLEEGKRP